jgi:hypothetical protein
LEKKYFYFFIGIFFGTLGPKDFLRGGGRKSLITVFQGKKEEVELFIFRPKVFFMSPYIVGFGENSTFLSEL